MDDGNPLGLGGTKQRATLGYLLLQANRVVSTSQLLEALWAVDDAPMSARKILQNAVWGLRRALAPSGPEGGPPPLVTQPPGYKLTVAPDDVDLYRFQAMAERGREALIAGRPESAAVLLREALDLWRGPVLADLVESGIAWPELSAVQNARLNAMEDCFDAELALGRHHAVLGELESVVEDTALRERSSGQLMLALYRSGRQADALNVYSRVRSVLAEDLGLEPGRELQALQWGILNHDQRLNAPVGTGEWEARGERVTASNGDRTPAPPLPSPLLPSPLLPALPLPASPPPAAAAGGDASWPHAPARGVPEPAVVFPPRVPVPDREPVAVAEPLPARDGARSPQLRPGPEAAAATRRKVSVLLMRTELGTSGAEGDVEAVDDLLERASRWIHQTIEYFGGRVTAAIGSILMAVFDTGEEGAEHAERAVLAALATQDGLRSAFLSTAPPGLREALSLRAAVTTGEAVLRYQPDDRGQPSSINGKLLNTCDSLLSRARAREIRACDTTRTATEAMIDFRKAPDGDGAVDWTVQGIRPEYVGGLRLPTVERESELSVLTGLLERAWHRVTPHVVTALGDPGIGKTRFLAEFGRIVGARANVAQLSLGRCQDPAAGGVFEIQRQLVWALCQVEPADPPSVRRQKITRAVHRLIDDPDRAARLLECLGQYTDPDSPGVGEDLEPWRRFLETTALDRPLVLLIDDLHLADETVLDFVAGLADISDVPLLVVAMARPELLQLRPEWGGGKRHVTTLTLDPLSDAAVDELLDCLLPDDPKAEAKDGAKWFRRALRIGLGDRQDERRRYLRSVLSIRGTRLARVGQPCRAAG
ncbi:BTAD domain-containing putative transcriptional regulator [Streptomyces sp. NPDC006487]|uniref:BTAD domain-containing putative transcriptional regulator n=1 Tax=Streptomyces sp. NPDC006487 TaxID=3364748 RepID=UPI003695C491